MAELMGLTVHRGIGCDRALWLAVKGCVAGGVVFKTGEGQYGNRSSSDVCRSFLTRRVFLIGRHCGSWEWAN